MHRFTYSFLALRAAHFVLFTLVDLVALLDRFRLRLTHAVHVIVLSASF